MIIAALLIPVSQSMWVEILGVGGMAGLGLAEGTATAGPSCVGADPSLEFEPDDCEYRACPPYQVRLALVNTGKKGYARSVEVTLSLVKGKKYVQSVGLPGGQTWDPSSSETFRLSIGDIAARQTTSVDLRVEMRPEFLQAGESEVKLRLVVTGEGCRPGHNANGHVKAHVTLLRQNGCVGPRTAPDGTVTPTETPRSEPATTPTPKATETPVPEQTEAPAPEATDTPGPPATSTPAPQATDTPVPSPEPTAAPAPEEPGSDTGDAG